MGCVMYNKTLDAALSRAQTQQCCVISPETLMDASILCVE